MTEEQKEKHREALKKMNRLGTEAVQCLGDPALAPLYTYVVGLHVVLDHILEDL